MAEDEVHYNPYIPLRQVLCKLRLNDGSIVELEGSGELTSAMTSAHKRSVVRAEIGEACTSIGNDAFSVSTAETSILTSVTISNSVTSIGDNAFKNCSSLTSITIPNSVTNIGKYAFCDCSKLTNVTIPDSVTSIGKDAFIYCSSLTSITIPNSVTSIGEDAFYDCSGIKTLNYNAQVEITSSIASGLTALETVIIGDSTPSIGNSAFTSCSSLTSVTIGNSVTSIGKNAFYNCSSLTSITVNAETPPTLGRRAINNTNDYPIYVPSSSVDAYKEANEWYKFASRIQAIPTT